MRRAIGYLRVSTEPQDAGRQSELIKDYCLNNNLDYCKEIREKISGANSDRAGRTELINLTSADGDIVIISETSRLSRENDILKLLNNVNDLLEAGLDVLFLDGLKAFKSGEVLTLFQIMQLSFEAHANSEERLKIAERCNTGRRSKIRQGCYIGHAVAFGFKVIPNPLRVGNSKEHGKSLYVVDEANKSTVQMIFDLVGNQSYTIRKAITYLNDNGILKNGKKWTGSVMSNILHNTLYYGNYSFKGETFNLEPIISKELFDKTELQLKSNVLKNNIGKVNFNPLKSLLKCPCGGNMLLTTKANDVKHYFCMQRRNKDIESTCTNGGINTEYLNKIIWQITQAFINQSDFALQTEQATKNLKANIESKDNQSNNLLKELEILNSDIDLFTTNLMKVSNDTTFKLIEDKLNIKINEQTELTNLISKVNKELLKLRLDLQNYSIKNDSKLMDSITEQHKNEIYLKYIDKITYYSDSKYKGFIDVHYKNGFKATVMTVTRKDKNAYLIPQSFSFNPITRNIIESYIEPIDQTKPFTYDIPPTITKESNYKEILQRYNVNEWEMSL